MIKDLERAIERVRGLTADRQAYAAEVLDQIASATEERHTLSDDERKLVAEGIAAADRGDFASEADIQALLARYRL